MLREQVDEQGRRRPNLFLIGAMKCGTTSLHNYLNAHPMVFMCEPKEPQFFVDTPWFPKDLTWYLSLFEGATDEIWLGESTTNYTMLPHFPGVAEKIHTFNPEAHFIYIMRDPIARIVSHYWQVTRQGREWRTLRRAVEEDHAYLALSDYAMQLRPYIQKFEASRVYTLTFEEMVGNPTLAVNQIFSWLGLEQLEAIPEVAASFNVRPDQVETARGRGLLHRVRRSNTWARVAGFVPKPLRRFGTRLAQKTVSPSDIALGDLEDSLREALLPKISDLSRLLGRKFPEWSTAGPVEPPSTT